MWAITGRTRRRSRPVMGPHRRLWTISMPAVALQKRPGEGTGEHDRGSAVVIGPRTTGRGITASPRRTPLDNDNRLTSLAGWAREMAISGRVSGAVAHLSKSRHAARRRDAIADRMLGMGTTIVIIQGVVVWETTGPPSDAAGRSADIAGGRHI